MKDRNISIDILKGLAIIAVILYHLGVSEYGYLGVDIFFVISGYLVTIGMVKSFSQNRFSYWNYLNKRVARLWPGLILIGAVSLILGWIYMMPLHYKLNCESVIGTCLFSNNIVQYITIGDYWTSSNEYKPLMHTWYIGVLMQFYLIFPLIFIIAKKCTRNWLQNSFIILSILALSSIILYMTPLMTDSWNFYMLPGRFFELASGGLLALVGMKNNSISKSIKPFFFSLLLVLAAIFMFGEPIGVMKLRLISVVCIAVFLVDLSNYFKIKPSVNRFLYPISFMGVASYSLYLSHQVFFAFYRYIVNSNFSVSTYLGVLCASIVIGIILYYVLEKPLSAYLSGKRKRTYYVNLICVPIAVVIVAVSFHYYRQDGLVKDIPELDLYLGKGLQTPKEYNDTPFCYNRDFDNNGKKNILVIGDSFGRDWINILKEAGVDSVMNISYFMYADEHSAERIKKADYVFIATNFPFFSSFNYEEIYPLLFNRKFYRLGLKSFGEEFIGNIYNNKDAGNYYSTAVREEEFSRSINEYESALFSDNFIDMMSPMKEKDGSIKMFTSDGKMITQDGIHLTKAGARLYAEKIDVWQYLR